MVRTLKVRIHTTNERIHWTCLRVQAKNVGREDGAVAEFKYISFPAHIYFVLPTISAAKGYEKKQNKILFVVKNKRHWQLYRDSQQRCFQRFGFKRFEPLHPAWLTAEPKQVTSYKIFNFLTAGEYLISWRLPQPHSAQQLLLLLWRRQ